MVSVKKNQLNLHNEMREAFSFFKSKIHQREETNLEPRGLIHKKFESLSLQEPLPDYALNGWFYYIKTIIRVTRTNLDTEKTEEQFYASNTLISVQEAKDLIIQHWNIENILHKTLDVALREDAARKKRAPKNWAHLRALVFNLLSKKININFTTTLFSNSLDLLKPLRILGLCIK